MSSASSETKRTDMVQVALAVQLPHLPNYLGVEALGEGGKIDVCTLSDDALRELGRRWTDALIEHARKRRQNHVR